MTTGNGSNERAACIGLVDIFYGPDVDLRQEPEGWRRERESIAKDICRGCPLRWPCLEWALHTDESFGVWGGLSHQERGRFLKLLRKEGYEEIPVGQDLKIKIAAFQGKEAAKRSKRKRRFSDQPNVRTLPSDRTRARSVSSENGARGVGRAASASQGVPGNRSNSGQSQGSNFKAAGPQGRNQGVSRGARGTGGVRRSQSG